MEYWVWLRQIKGLGPIIEKRLLNHFITPKLIYKACEEELMTIMGIGNTLAKNIISSRSLDKAYSVLEECKSKNIKLLTYDDPLYPSIAKDYAEAPTLLYYRGNIIENIEGVAIVGSRRCSDYGKEVAIGAAEYLAQNNITVISGMAKGIDGYSHIACLRSGGYTIAFLGNGVDVCYPTEHRELMEAIIDNGAVISEYLPGTRARAEFFPKRNGLISSWSRKVLIVEAAERSGALITANLAKLQGKEIYVPPHEIYSSTGRGTNQLISQGANIYLHPSQLIIDNSSNLEVLIKQDSPKKKISNERSKIEVALLPIEEKILSCIIDTSKTIEEIGRAIKMNEIDLIEYISIMELEGKIKAIVGGRYSNLLDL